jgi:hypothetical protein
LPGHTLAYTAASHTARCRIDYGWPVAGRAAARAAGIPAAPTIRGSRAASPRGGVLIYFEIPEISFFPLKNPRKFILTPKIVKPLPENF